MDDEQKQKKKLLDTDPIRRRMDEEGKRAYDLMFSKHYVLSATILGYIIGTLVIFVGIGYLLDTYFGTKPLLMIIGLLLSFISTQILLYKKFSKP